ncbi:triose-phosphate isomerase [Helicobacter sp. MIT 21-1697]|uniref:triose-phosphate isomerase n=1 Tax=Helicobacter sp. MIT 21-1697 TaxID=2993733 RepID=UPI00224B4578|nr:triose-phosphate isomerase [Helicobacter sp. MIT 21-1697]MCX2717206.1 triose-phosphate isomerase [Helicobacter sp. MIT 21-1697]
MAIIAGNFKANLTRAQVINFATELDSILADINSASTQSLSSQLQVDIFPSHTALLTDDFTHFHIGAQNAYFAQSGGFTGEIGLSQLQEFNINRLIIGHSERRTLFGEHQDFINEKFRFYTQAGFEIYYCIGEDLSVRQKGENALKDFLSAQLAGIDTSYPKLIIAYEPIWAIGTGVSATLEQITSTHQMLSQLVSAPLLYGGSVNPSNAGEILSLSCVDGVLVGSASLNIQSFAEIIRAGLKA